MIDNPGVTSVGETAQTGPCSSGPVSGEASSSSRLRLFTPVHESEASEAHGSTDNQSSSEASRDLTLSTTVAGEGRSVTAAPSSTAAGQPPPLHPNGKAASREVPLVVETSAELLIMTPQLRQSHHHQQRYSSCNHSTELGAGDPVTRVVTPVATPRSQKLRVFPIASNAVDAGALRDRYTVMDSDSMAFTPPFASAMRSGQLAGRTVSVGDDGVVSSSRNVDGDADEVLVFYDAHSPHKRVRRRGEACESPSFRYRAGTSSQASCGDMSSPSLSAAAGDAGHTTAVNLTSATPMMRMDTSLNSSKRFESPCLTMSSESSLRLVLSQHGHARHSGRPIGSAAAGNRSEAAPAQRTVDRSGDVSECADGPLLVSSSAVPLAHRGGGRPSPRLPTTSADGAAVSPLCADSAQFSGTGPTITTSIPRPVARVPREYSPRIERSPDENSVDFTRVPIPGDVRINILGRGAAAFDDDDDDDSDVDYNTRDKRLQEQVERMYGRIVKAHQQAAGGTESGRTQEQGTSPADEAPREVVARSPASLSNSAVASPKVVRFRTDGATTPNTPGCDKKPQTADGESGQPTPIAVSRPPRQTHRVAFQLPESSSTPSSRPHSPCAGRSTSSAGTPDERVPLTARGPGTSPRHAEQSVVRRPTPLPRSSGKERLTPALPTSPVDAPPAKAPATLPDGGGQNEEAVPTAKPSASTGPMQTSAAGRVTPVNGGGAGEVVALHSERDCAPREPRCAPSGTHFERAAAKQRVLSPEGATDKARRSSVLPGLVGKSRTGAGQNTVNSARGRSHPNSGTVASSQSALPAVKKGPAARKTTPQRRWS